MTYKKKYSDGKVKQPLSSVAGSETLEQTSSGIPIESNSAGTAHEILSQMGSVKEILSRSGTLEEIMADKVLTSASRPVQIIGYLRLCSGSEKLNQKLSRECHKVFKEKPDASKRYRPELQRMVDYVKNGDEIIVNSMDILAADLRDFVKIIERILNTGVSIEFLKEKLKLNASKDALQNSQFKLLKAILEFEESVIRQRQAEGIARRKELDRLLPNSKRAYRGRAIKIDTDKIVELWKKGKTPSEITRELCISRSSVYRLLKKNV